MILASTIKSKLILVGLLVLVVFTFLLCHRVSATNRDLRPVCSQMPGAMSCDAWVLSGSGRPLVTPHYSSGLTPSDLVSAYKLPALPTSGSSFRWNGRTVAIIDAYDNPNAATDLVVYREQFHLPLCVSSATHPSASQLTSCFFSKLNQLGKNSPLPSASSGWGQEIDLDVQMASTACPNCKILLVEAKTSSMTNLGAAVNTAAALKANAISNSYGEKEFSSEAKSTYSAYYNHPGIAITASAGDDGYGVQFPADLPYVTAVGGTSLYRSISFRGWTETAWQGSGSGCSKYISKLSWQASLGSCKTRVVADVAAVADPYTGVAVYNSYGQSGWSVVGGTSAGAPLIAGLYALAGNTGSSKPAIKYGEHLYSHSRNLFDVKGGANGSCFSNLALCTAVSGFDGPTGLGSPNGLTAF